MAGIRLLDPARGPFCALVPRGGLQAATEVAPFYEVAIEMCSEVATNSAILARSSGGKRSPRDEGVLRGLVVRTVKLVDRLIDETVQQHGEMQTLFSRLILETVVNVGWLLNSADRTQQFIEDGLKTATVRRKQIEDRVAQSGGEPRPIEVRQLQAIEDELRIANLVPGQALKRLPSMEQRIDDAYGGAAPLAYDFGFRLGSAAVHGSWKDLVAGHIDSADEYAAILEWKEPDVQAMLSLLLLVAPILHQYAAHVEDREVGEAFESLADRARLVFDFYGPLFESRRDGS